MGTPMLNTQTNTLKKTFTVRMTENKLSLNWKDFETNMTAALKDLREEKHFFDVTIACEDNQIQAHKVILSACSTFFRNLLRRNPHQHPLLYLKGVKYKELLGILDFMYNGEVNISQEELKQFLAIAADLKVQGLTQKMAIPTTDPIIPSKSTVTTSTPLPTRVNSQKRESAEKEPPKKRLRPSPTTPAKPIATPTRAIATPTKPITTPTRAYQQVDNDEILEVVSTQSVLKASPTLNNSPKVYRPQPPRKPIQDTTPAPQILEQCILEAEIDTNEEARRGAEVAQEKNKKTPAMTPTRGAARVLTPKALPPRVKLAMTPMTGHRWQCNICVKAFICKEDIYAHLAKRHHISKSSGIIQNMKKVIL